VTQPERNRGFEKFKRRCLSRRRVSEKERKKRPGIQPGLFKFIYTSISPDKGSDYGHDWQELSDQPLRHMRSNAKHRRPEQNRNTSLNTSCFYTLDISFATSSAVLRQQTDIV
jgi:hypothetical protein